MNKVLPREDCEELHSLIVRHVDPLISWEILSLKAVFLTMLKSTSIQLVGNHLLEILRSSQVLLEKKSFCNLQHLNRIMLLFVSKRFQLDGPTFKTLFDLQSDLLSKSPRTQPSHLITLLTFGTMLHPYYQSKTPSSLQIKDRIMSHFDTLDWTEKVRVLWTILAAEGCNLSLPDTNMSLRDCVAWAQTDIHVLRNLVAAHAEQLANTFSGEIILKATSTGLSRSALFTRQVKQLLELVQLFLDKDVIPDREPLHSRFSQILDIQTVHYLTDTTQMRRLNLLTDQMNTVDCGLWAVIPQQGGNLYSIGQKTDMGFDSVTLTGLGQLERRLRYLRIGHHLVQAGARAQTQHSDLQSTQTESDIWTNNSSSVNKRLSEVLDWTVTEVRENELKHSLAESD